MSKRKPNNRLTQREKRYRLSKAYLWVEEWSNKAKKAVKAGK